jgi:hypothetical protein
LQNGESERGLLEAWPPGSVVPNPGWLETKHGPGKPWDRSSRKAAIVHPSQFGVSRTPDRRWLLPAIRSRSRPAGCSPVTIPRRDPRKIGTFRRRESEARGEIRSPKFWTEAPSDQRRVLRPRSNCFSCFRMLKSAHFRRRDRLPKDGSEKNTEVKIELRSGRREHRQGKGGVALSKTK